MNYLAHAWVATWYSAERHFVLGSMLPDFASMIRARVGEVRHPQLRAGIELHHQSDAAFHRAPAFLQLCRAGRSDLAARGLRRGPARGAAHVGVEMLLDGTLPREEGLRGCYDEALCAAVRLDLSWSPPAGAERFAQLHPRLRRIGVPESYADPERVAERLARALERRPRLALTARETRGVADWLATAQADVRAAAPQLFSELRAALEAPPPPTPSAASGSV